MADPLLEVLLAERLRRKAMPRDMEVREWQIQNAIRELYNVTHDRASRVRAKEIILAVMGALRWRAKAGSPERSANIQAVKDAMVSMGLRLTKSHNRRYAVGVQRRTPPP